MVDAPPQNCTMHARSRALPVKYIKETIKVKRYSFFSTALVLMACAVLFSASAFAQHTNPGKHMTGGHGSSHKGGHYSSTSQGNKHLVGGSGASHKGGHYVSSSASARGGKHLVGGHGQSHKGGHYVKS